MLAQVDAVKIFSFKAEGSDDEDDENSGDSIPSEEDSDADIVIPKTMDGDVTGLDINKLESMDSNFSPGKVEADGNLDGTMKSDADALLGATLVNIENVDQEDE